LESFIVSCIKNIDGFKNRFRAHFAEQLEEDSGPQYRSIIRNYAKAAEGRYGFIDYRSAPTLTRPLWELNNKAERLLDEGQTRECITLCQALIEEVPVFIYNMDDSDGSAGDVVMFAFDTLENLAENSPENIKKELFEWCMQEFNLQKYHDFDFQGNFLRILPLVIITKEQEEQLFEQIDRWINQEKEKKYSDYGIAQLIGTKIEYLKLQKREQEILELLETHIRLPQFREQLIDRALEKEAFERAKKLCREGIAIARENKHRGTVNRWQEKIFKIAKKQHNLPEMRKWADTLFFNNYNMQWYRALKDTYSEQEWSQKCEELIDRIKKSDHWRGHGQVNILAQIFAEEDYTGRLLKLLQQNDGDISFVERYAGELKDTYPEEILTLYEQGIIKEARHTGRKHYRQITYWIKKMKNMKGGDERAYALYKKLLRDYNNRPAMKDEFEKAFPKWGA